MAERKTETEEPRGALLTLLGRVFQRQVRDDGILNRDISRQLQELEQDQARAGDRVLPGDDVMERRGRKRGRTLLTQPMNGGTN